MHPQVSSTIYLDASGLIHKRPSGIEGVLANVSHHEREFNLTRIFWDEGKSQYCFSDGSTVYFKNNKLILVSPIMSEKNYIHLENLLDKNKDLGLHLIFHDFLPWVNPSWFPEHAQSRLARYLNLSRMAKSVVTVSELVGEQYEKIISSLNILDGPIPIIIKHPLPTVSNEIPCSGNPLALSREINVLLLGNIEPRKNLPIALETIAQLNRENDFVVRIVGANTWHMESFWENLKSYSDSGLPIEVFKNATKTTLEALWLKSDLLFYPSLAEGFGLPVSEALIRNIPVVALRSTPSTGVQNSHLFAAEKSDILTFSHQIRLASKHVDCVDSATKIRGSIAIRNAEIEWGRSYLEKVLSI